MGLGIITDRGESESGLRRLGLSNELRNKVFESSQSSSAFLREQRNVLRGIHSFEHGEDLESFLENFHGFEDSGREILLPNIPLSEVLGGVNKGGVEFIEQQNTYK